MKDQIAFDLQIPILFYLRDWTCMFFRSRRHRAPGKRAKSLPNFLYASKIIGEAQSLWLPNPAEPGVIHLEMPVAHPQLASLASCRFSFSHCNSASPAAAATLFLPCSRVAGAAREPPWESPLRCWRRTSFEAAMWLRIALPYSHSLETRLQQGVCEALRVWKRIAERASSYRQTQPAGAEISAM